MDLIKKFAVPLVVVALVAAAAITMFSGDKTKRLQNGCPRD